MEKVSRTKKSSFNALFLIQWINLKLISSQKGPWRRRSDDSRHHYGGKKLFKRLPRTSKRSFSGQQCARTPQIKPIWHKRAHKQSTSSAYPFTIWWTGDINIFTDFRFVDFIRFANFLLQIPPTHLNNLS